VSTPPPEANKDKMILDNKKKISEYGEKKSKNKAIL
jgi:hypothetical protein